jgi:hypothetical protein
MDVRSWTEISAGITIPTVFFAVIFRAIWWNKGIGARVIQFTTVSMLIPVILILGLEKILEPATLGTLIGGLIGYVLSGVGDYRSDQDQ